MNVLVNENSLQDMADAIREITSTDEKIKPSEMGNAQRNFANNLITTANATTGKEDTTLTDAVSSLVSGFGQGGNDHTQEDSLISRTLTEYSNDRITYIGAYAFHDCKNLTRVGFPNVTRVGGYAFNECSALSEVYLPNVGDGESLSLSSRVFQNCTSLKSISLPKCRRITSASPYIFYNCISLENIDLPSLIEIVSAQRIFSGCTSLTKIKLQSLQKIGTSLTFENCTNLIALILPYESVVSLGNTNNFTGTPIESGTGYIYVPKALIEDYKVATNWTTFADQFRAIEDYPEICGGGTE